MTPTPELREGGHILYKSGSELFYAPSGDETGSFNFDYVVNGRTIHLNELIGRQGWRMVPVEGNFMVSLSENGVVRAQPEIHLAVPSLRAGEERVLSALHEIGHARLYGQIADAHEGLPLPKVSAAMASNLVAYAKAPRYEPEEMVHLKFERRNSFGEQIIRACLALVGKIGETHYHKLQERTAWAYALRSVRTLGLLPGFSREDLREFYIGRLCSYGSDFAEPRPFRVGK